MDETKQGYSAAAARLGMNICAALGTGEIYGRDVDQYAARNWDIQGISVEAGHQLDQNLGCRLFSRYGNTAPHLIKSDEKIYDLARELWFMCSLSQMEEPCGYAALRSLYDRKFQEEQQKNPSVRPGYFYQLLNYYLHNDLQIAQVWGILRKSRQDIQRGLNAVLYFFASRPSRFICEIYAAPEAGTPVNTPAPASPVPAAQIPPEAPAPARQESAGESERTQGTLEKMEGEIAQCHRLLDQRAAELAECHEVIASQAEQIQNYRTQMDYLEKARRKAQVDLDHACKDTVREILECLTSERFGAPLSELYLLGRNPDLADAVRAVTLNLFAALESLKISVYGTNRIGQTVSLTPDTQKRYSPAYGEEITMEDAVTLRYPGYRYGREPLIRPVIEKVRKEHGSN